jgi:hypothetical protein
MKALHSFALAAALLVAAGSASAFSLEEAAQAAAAMAGSSGNAGGGSNNGNAATFPVGGGAGGLASLGALGGLGGASNASTLGLVNALGALNVTPQQAVGGTGALLSLAQNSLGSDQYSQLSGAVPGLDQLTGSNGLNQLGALSGLLGGAQQQPVPAQTGALLNNVSNLQQLNQAFSALGMQTGLVAQFAPILLQFLGAQGVGNSLLQNLSGAWGVPGALAPAAGLNVPAAAGGGY